MAARREVTASMVRAEQVVEKARKLIDENLSMGLDNYLSNIEISRILSNVALPAN